MKKLSLHTPDGVRDIYDLECERKLILQEKLHQVLKSYGYHDIQTPSFEFFHIFGYDIGTTPSKDLYKFFDKDGNTLALRPDFTPSIARSAATYYMEEDMPVKLCYIGNTFINSSKYQGRLRENTQCGAELIGDNSTAADAEILAMTVNCLQASGLHNFQISVGHARFFQGLVEAAAIDEETTEQLREYILNKNFLGAEEITESMDIPQNLKDLFLLLGQFDTSPAQLAEAKEKAIDYPGIYSSLEELERLHTFLKFYGIEKYISYELGIISRYSYYTGIIFSGYTFGTGEPIVNGGRYDDLLSYFGKNAPAIGFAIVVDQLMNALSRQKIQIPVTLNNALLVFKPQMAEEAVKKAMKLRAKGIKTEMILWNDGKTREDYVRYAASNHINKVEFLEVQ